MLNEKIKSENLVTAYKNYTCNRCKQEIKYMEMHWLVTYTPSRRYIRIHEFPCTLNV